MGDSQGKGRTGYNTWSTQESSTLLELMVDAANRGWRDSNGVLSRQTVEKKILHILNERLGCQKNYAQYQSRLKWFKQRYHNYSDLMRYSSGFGWDSSTKKFTASDEVWENYFKSHPNQKHLRTDTFADFEDLRIAIGNGTATGRNSIALGDDTDARIYGVEDDRRARLEDYMFDESQGVDERSYESPAPSHEQYTSSPPIMEHNVEVPSENSGKKRRTRTENERSSSSVDSMNRADVLEKISIGMDSISTIATDIRRMHNLMEKRESDREKREIEKKERHNKNNIWNAIKETPNLDSRTRYKAGAFIHKLGMKEAFLTMSIEERYEWIKYNVE